MIISGEFHVSSGQSLWFNFVSDEVTRGRGFNITVKPLVFGRRLYDEDTNLELKKKVNDTRVDKSATEIYYQKLSAPGKQVLWSVNQLGGKRV